ncbi:hypothetical protein P22_0500 [Propionispora sp. 2/2-37]|uniref:carbon storage regulator CsrA n=1 Tax=Propionispora sp. 2/2-37 TaxID=1677858 RepID=UPI0006BB8503|nr:carbon storage regulator CsrA [Propionispora sp. 2/2-37]CUH94434.1 hypothetical protein P22_0500 [Propionispora sp. 2/2-37]
MLVLTRKAGEKIVIGDNIEVTVAEIKGDSVRLALHAPKQVKIYRGEIFEAIVEENKQAATNIVPDALDSLLQVKGQTKASKLKLPEVK